MKLLDRALTMFGDMLLYPWPMWFLYRPHGYAIKGEHTREIMAAVQPGDVLLRGYRYYLDGMVIPGKYSHAALYIGDLDGQPQRVVHSLAEGVIHEDLIHFCRCDRLTVLRIQNLVPTSARMICGRAIAFLGREYDFGFDNDLKRLYCTELVRACVSPYATVKPTEIRMLGFRKRVAKATDDALDRIKRAFASQEEVNQRLAAGLVDLEQRLTEIEAKGLGDMEDLV